MNNLYNNNVTLFVQSASVLFFYTFRFIANISHRTLKLAPLICRNTKYTGGRDALPRNGCCFERFEQRSRRIEIRVNQSAAKFEPPVYYVGKLLPFPGEFDLSPSAAHYYRAVLDAVAAAAAYRVRVSVENFFN